MSDKPVVFVSCGQYAEAEKRLGSQVCDLLKELRPDVEPYFAQDQTTSTDLSSHILGALFRAAGFICIMHRRGDLQTPEGATVTRGSVWLEQEIAVVALMNHVLARSIPVFYYKQRGVGIEGIRSVLLMNPRVEFDRESEVLEHLRSVLPTTKFNPYADYDIDAVVNYKELEVTSDRHKYTFSANVKNVGNQKVTDFEMRLFFPRAFLNPHVTWRADNLRSTESHICFIATAKTRAPDGLYSGEMMREPLTIEYFVDDPLFDSNAMKSEIRIELFSGSMKPKRLNLAIRDFQHF